MKTVVKPNTETSCMSNINRIKVTIRSRDSSVGIVLGYGLDDRGVRVLAVAGNFSLDHRVQTSSGAHPASYPMGARVCFPGR
jgi:hypothetical protein